MPITIKCFAVIKDIVGQDELSLELDSLATPTLQSAWDELEKKYPGLKGKQKYVRFSKNHAFVSNNEPLADGDEIGIIPPVAGG